MLEEIASGNGDPSRRMTVESEDEIGALAAAFNRFVSSLNATIVQVRESTGTIAFASADIASGNLDLSNRTEAQASSLEETAAAMEELTSTVKQNAALVEEAAAAAKSLQDEAAKLAHVVSVFKLKESGLTAVYADGAHADAWEEF